MDDKEEIFEEVGKKIDDVFASMKKEDNTSSTKTAVVTGRKRVRRTRKEADLSRITKKAEKIAYDIVKEEEKKELREQSAKRKLRKSRRFNKSDRPKLTLIEVDDDTWEDAELKEEFVRNHPDKVAMAIDIIGGLLIVGLLTTGVHYVKEAYNEGYKMGTELMNDLPKRINDNREAEKAKWGPYYYTLHPEEKPDNVQEISKEGDDENERGFDD